MTSFSDEQVASFATAVIGVASMTQKYQDRIAATTDENELTALEEEKRGVLVAMIKAQGLTIGDYNGMVRASRNDPALRQRIESFIGNLQ